MLEELRQEGVSERLIAGIEKFRKDNATDAALAYRVPDPKYMYYGTEVWEQAITAVLGGENLLLVGPKATGKNVLAQNLARVFGRPGWDISMHVNTDAASLIGTDTLREGKVVLRRGPVYECAVNGGFGILDEINMAKNEALAVLHATLDFRRAIDVPGYDRIVLHPATRFVGTMNYGYAGTRELNEALASRFMVINMPLISAANIQRLLKREYPALRPEWAKQFAELFEDLQRKCESSEISTKALDLRGLLSAIGLMAIGLDAASALDMGLVNKVFEPFERQLVSDVIRARIPAGIEREKLFGD